MRTYASSRKIELPMFLLISSGHISAPKRYTDMASPYNALQRCVKRFGKQLGNCGPQRPETWTNCLYISLLNLHKWLVVIITLSETKETRWNLQDKPQNCPYYVVITEFLVVDCFRVVKLSLTENMVFGEVYSGIFPYFIYDNHILITRYRERFDFNTLLRKTGFIKLQKT